jgi:hypothetical protein
MGEERFSGTSETLTSDSKEKTYVRHGDIKSEVSKGIGLGLISALSAVAGVLAVVWWHRKTLTKLQNPILCTSVEQSHGGRIVRESNPTALSEPLAHTDREKSAGWKAS